MALDAVVAINLLHITKTMSQNSRRANTCKHLQVSSGEKKQDAFDEENGIAIGNAVARVSDVAPFHTVNALIVGLKRVFGKVIQPTKQGEGGDELDAKQGAGVRVHIVDEVCNDEICNDTAGQYPEVGGDVCRAGELEQHLADTASRVMRSAVRERVDCNIPPRERTWTLG